MTPLDVEARRRALTEHDRDMLVEASAGTGKTAVIAGRAALLMAAGRPPGSIAAITYTESAAAELAARIRAYVEALARGEAPPELASALPTGVQERQRARAAEALAGIDGLVATTIHGFCRGIVLEHAVEAGIDPGAVVMDGDEADALFERVLSAWLGRRLSVGTDAGRDDPVAVLALEDPEHAIDVLRVLARFRRSNPGARPRDGSPGLARDAEALAAAAEGFVRWTGSVPAEESAVRLAADLRDLASLCLRRAEGAIGFRELWAISRSPESELVDGDGARLVRCRVGAWTWRRAVGDADARRIGDEAKARYDACGAAYADVAAGIGSALLAALSAEVDELLGEYARAKAEAAALDFDDLLQHADGLLRGYPDVRRAVSDRYRAILVDEVQDTDAFQASMLLSITGLGDSGTSAERRRGSLFMVGDPKQAIYRFRGADPASYAELRAAIEAADPDGVVHLTANFRSQAGILEHVDRCLAESLEAAASSDYLPLVAVRKHVPDDVPRVARLDVQAERGDKVDVLRDAEARAVAALCADLIGSRIPLGNGGSRVVRPRDIALLSPTHNGLRRWEGALLDAAVPVSPLAGKSLLARQEAFDFLALVRTLADPRDTLAFGALLRGPLVGLTDAEILSATASLPNDPNGGVVTLAATTDPGAVAHPVLAGLLAALRRLRIAGAGLAPETLLLMAIEHLRVRAVLSVRSLDGGASAQANVDALVRRARPYAVRGLGAFAAMLQAKWADVLRNPFRDWPEGRCDDGEDAVTLLTVHNAKGLEWPVVIVVNSMSGERPPDPFLHRRSDGTLHGSMPRLASRGHADARSEEALAERSERVRLWYVACTRARDLLVLPRISRLPDKAWARLVDLRLGELPEVPLSGRPQASGATPPVTNGQCAALFAREADNVAAASPPILWRRPSDADPDRRDVTSASPDLDAVVPTDVAGGGRSRGAVVHKLIEEMLTGELLEAEAVVRERASMLLSQLASDPGPTPDPAECASTAMGALAMPDVAKIRGSLIPEWPVHAAMTDGSLVAGRADAVALGAEGQVEVVFDWKSDLDPDPASRLGYVAQMSEYLKATGAARGAIVYVSRAEVRWVRLDDA